MSANTGSLGDLQRAFQDYLLASSESFQAAVRDTRKANRVTLLDVYRDGYALRLIEALTTDYPGLMAMAGPADFDHMARAYITAHPSRHPSIRWFGKDVADFLGATPPYSRTPAAAEMARFEWALGETFDSPDATPVTADALVALPPEAWETLAFTALPSLRRLTLEFDVPQAWQRRDEVEPGNLKVERDWGFAPDYVEGMCRILRQIEVRARHTGEPQADVATNYRDYVLATGKTHAVWELVDCAFTIGGFELEWELEGRDPAAWQGRFRATGKLAVVVNPNLLRTAEPLAIQVDPSRARKELGWAAREGLEVFLQDMFAKLPRPAVAAQS